jgi:hypothetical protein
MTAIIGCRFDVVGRIIVGPTYMNVVGMAEYVVGMPE